MGASIEGKPEAAGWSMQGLRWPVHSTP